MKAFIESHAWRDRVDIRLGDHYGRVIQYAAGIDESGAIVWEQGTEGTDIPVLLSVSRDVLEALAVALGAHVPEAATTVEALKDARVIRDRLLALVEEGWRS